MSISMAAFNSNKYLENLITSFTLKLISSGVCVWDNLQESSIDAWQAKQATSVDNTTILILQFSCSAIRRFMEGIEFDVKRISRQFATTIVQDTEEIRLELDDYIRSNTKSINVELWIYELTTALADLSGFIQNVLRTNKVNAT